MQKTSKFKEPGFYDPIGLPKDFPITRPGFKTPPDLAHVHNCFEIGLCRSGAGIFIVEDKIFSCMAGDAIFINNREFHALKNASPLNSEWRFVNLDPLALLAAWLPAEENFPELSRFSGASFSNLVREKDHPDIVFITRRLIEELEKGKGECRSLVRSLVWTLMLMLRKLVPEEIPEEAGGEPEDIKRIYPALRHISSHYSRNMDIQELAELCHCSISTFRRIFQKSLGTLPVKYINAFRLKAAAVMLLSTNRSVLDIAMDSGFSSLSNFNRQFKTEFKKSPREYRRRGE
jgi:AraC-like DNA-binding protein/mannose-6-phosphate isomerase-like protein (cupin superfamily)